MLLFYELYFYIVGSPKLCLQSVLSENTWTENLDWRTEMIQVTLKKEKWKNSQFQKF